MKGIEQRSLRPAACPATVGAHSTDAADVAETSGG